MSERLVPVEADELEVGAEYQVTGVWRGRIVDLDGIALDEVRVWISASEGRTLEGVARGAGAERDAPWTDGLNLIAFERVDLLVPELPGAVIRCLMSSAIEGATPVRCVAERRTDGVWVTTGGHQVYGDDRIVRVLAVLDPGGES